MSDEKKKKLEVHKDIASEYNPPYWRVEVYREPKFPPEQYELPLRNHCNKELFDVSSIQYPCGYCKYEYPKLIWVDENLTNAGGSIEYEFYCEKCGIYTFYDGQEFS